MNLDQAAIMMILAGMLAAFASERWRVEKVALAGLALAFVAGVVPVASVFLGFSSAAVVTVVEIILIVPEDIYMRPATPFVSDFGGDTNSLPVSIREGTAFLAGKPVFDCPHLAFTGGSATLNFRPHDVEGAEPDRPCVLATVDASYRKGGLWRGEATMEGVETPVEIDVDGALPRPQVGERLSIAIARAQIFPDRVLAA